MHIECAHAMFNSIRRMWTKWICRQPLNIQPAMRFRFLACNERDIERVAILFGCLGAIAADSIPNLPTIQYIQSRTYELRYIFPLCGHRTMRETRLWPYVVHGHIAYIVCTFVCIARPHSRTAEQTNSERVPRTCSTIPIEYTRAIYICSYTYESCFVSLIW